jgi:tetratricopeptide (TPR) repeat protein
LLLDRRKIRKRAKWVALALAIIFAVSFITMGVGYGSGGFNVFDAFSGCSQKTESTSPASELDQQLAAIEADPTDTADMQKVATTYEDMYDSGQGDDYLYQAAYYLQQAITADPSLVDVSLRLADLYMVKMAPLIGEASAGQQAASVLTDAAGVDPDNPEIWLKLGSAQKGAGNITEAVLAWQRYLKLAPDGQYADLIQEQLDALTATTTTAAETTTTAAPASNGTTTAPVTTTTTG